jgi:GDPmannose 4,6-dehydratase
MWLMLQQETPKDYVIATGITKTVREFCELAFKEVGINMKFTGKGINEKGIDINTGKEIIEIDPRYFRPTEVELLVGNSDKARKELGWKPKTTLEELVTLMVKHDLKELSAE